MIWDGFCGWPLSKALFARSIVIRVCIWNGVHFRPNFTFYSPIYSPWMAIWKGSKNNRYGTYFSLCCIVANYLLTAMILQVVGSFFSKLPWTRQFVTFLGCLFLRPFAAGWKFVTSKEGMKKSRLGHQPLEEFIPTTVWKSPTQWKLAGRPQNPRTFDHDSNIFEKVRALTKPGRNHLMVVINTSTKQQA